MKLPTIEQVYSRYNDYYHEFGNGIEGFLWAPITMERAAVNAVALDALKALHQKLKTAEADKFSLFREHPSGPRSHFYYMTYLIRVNEYLLGGHYANACNELLNLFRHEAFMQRRIKDNITALFERYLQ